MKKTDAQYDAELAEMVSIFGQHLNEAAQAASVFADTYVEFIEVLSQNRSGRRLIKKVNRDSKLWHIYVP